MIIQLIVLAFQLIISSSALSSFKELCDALTPVEGRRIGTSKSNLRLLENEKKKQFLLKQVIKIAPKAQIKLIYDVIGSQMAQALGLPCADTELIPLHSECCHKFFKDRLAILMTRVPGVIIRKGSKYLKLDLRQNVERGNVEELGVSLTVIQNASLHKDLILMLALDTYLGNIDRSPGNASYDEATDRFYAIDFGQSFKAYLCRAMRATLDKVKEGLYTLTSDQYEALSLYRNALRKLLELYPSRKIEREIDYYVDRSGLTDRSLVGSKFRDAIGALTDKLKEFMSIQYKEAHDLVDYIDEVIAAQSR